ncbi:MAG: AI-2E family transporter [Anaerolineales bacterium]|nr:AI-2E family transporter [Anaerolineales bacterium]
MSQNTGNSPKWSVLTKAFVALTLLVVFIGLVSRFQAVIPILVMAIILAFLVVPVVRFLCVKLRVPWPLGANLCFLILLLILIGVSTATGFAVVQQLQALFLTIQRFLTELPDQLAAISQQTYIFGPWEFDLAQFDLPAVAENLLASIQPILGRMSSIIASLATGAIESIASVVFTLAVAYFIILDYPRIRSTVIEISIPGYKEDLHRLRSALADVWHAFLRGQLVVVTSTGLLTWMLMSILGLRFSLGLGVLGGIAKFVPMIGPFLAGFIAALVALFQPTNWFGLTPLGHAILVVICVAILDQLIDYLIVPRIMGASLNLHPAVILVALLIGASLAGILGLLLSAPMMASLVLLGKYTYRKMFDLSPWEPPIDVLSRPGRRPLRLLQWVERLQQRWKSR